MSGWREIPRTGCDAAGCNQDARYAWIGESGDFFACAQHAGDAPTDPPDLPDGWTWKVESAVCPALSVRHEGRTVAYIELTGAERPNVRGQAAPFASEIADGLTRLLAALGGE